MEKPATVLGVSMGWMPKTTLRRLLFLLFVLYAAIQTSRGLYQLFTWDQSDLMLIRDYFWGVLGGEAVSTPYLPNTMLLLSPIYLLPWPATRIVMLGVNLVLIWYIWQRLSAALQLSSEKRAWLLVLFLCWVSVRVTIAHGQLGFLALAAILWAWTTPRATPWGLAVSTIKPSISFPVLLDQLLKKPLVLLPSLGLVAAGITWFLLATNLPASEYPAHLIETMARPQESGFGVDLVSALDRTLGVGSSTLWIVGAIWLVAFLVLRKRVQHPHALLAVLLAMSMLPVYHRFYDLVVLAPTLAFLLKWRPLGFAIAMTIGLAGADTLLLTQGVVESPEGMALLGWYVPMLVVALIAVVVRTDAVSDVFDPGSPDVLAGRRPLHPA